VWGFFVVSGRLDSGATQNHTFGHSARLIIDLIVEQPGATKTENAGAEELVDRDVVQ